MASVQKAQQGRPKTKKIRPLSLFRLPSIIDLHKLSSRSWTAEQIRHDFDTFRRAAETVTAYGRFLKKAHIRPASVKTPQDLADVPATSKDSYLRKYPWKELISERALEDSHLVLAATSGSTGKPFYFPRNTGIDEHSALYHKLFMENTGLDPEKSTLVIVGFGMGVWIGGIITYEAMSRVSETGFPVTIVTPGTNKNEIFEALREVAPQYEQVIVCGYPPFIKDLIDEGATNGIDWKKMELRILCAAESFSETFRDYICKHGDIKDPLRGIANIYGSADLGTMAMETPLAILVRRLAVKNPTLFKEIFGDVKRLPTFAQFIPSCVNFEEREGSLFCTADNALPLVRYDIGDRGGVFTYDEMIERCRNAGIDIEKEIKKAGISDTVCKIPFVYVYERTDLSTKLYGAIIYPEHVKIGLLEPQLEEHITGKFTMITQHDEKENEYLEVHVEMQPGITSEKELAKSVTDSVMDALLQYSAEHKNNASVVGDRVRPRVVLWPHAHPEHFKQGIKQKWVKKR